MIDYPSVSPTPTLLDRLKACYCLTAHNPDSDVKDANDMILDIITYLQAPYLEEVVAMVIMEDAVNQSKRYMFSLPTAKEIAKAAIKAMRDL
ncbi:MAG: hypothetical protein WCL30_01040 [Pseudomonadota bacterium]